MSIIFFSTVVRYDPNTAGGELVKVDWSSKKVLARTVIAPRSLQLIDPDPRRNTCGGRGIAIIDEKILVASYCELQIFDKDLNHLDTITNNLMAGLHEVFYSQDQNLWLTSTAMDAAIKIDLHTNNIIDQIWPSEMSEFQQKWNLKPLDINKNEDNRTRFLADKWAKNKNHVHFNAITEWHGMRFGLLNRKGAVVNLSTGEVVVEDPAIIGSHNLIIIEDGTIFVNDTIHQTIKMYEMNGELIKQINLQPFHHARRNLYWYKNTRPLRFFLKRTSLAGHLVSIPFSVRGMDIVEDNIFVGISPASVLCVNWKEAKLVDEFNYTSDNRVAVHGLRVHNS